jgi:hypothetical protein
VEIAANVAGHLRISQKSSRYKKWTSLRMDFGQNPSDELVFPLGRGKAVFFAFPPNRHFQNFSPPTLRRPPSAFEERVEELPPLRSVAAHAN